MKSGRPIDISKSSLVSLKAELSRKQEEVEKAKSSASYVRPTPKLKLETKSNPGIQGRIDKDVELTEEEVDKLKKSREILELKAHLYDNLQSGNFVQDTDKSEYLVDFKQKALSSDSARNIENPKEDSGPERNSEYFDSESEDENGWVEYTDCLGRTRKCLREDLPSVKDRDESLATSLYGKKREPPVPVPTSEASELELMSNDMHKEFLRKKWEEQEEMLAFKQSVYYEDIRFDEARTHGVGYYQFSTNQARRETEQEQFKKVREETEKRQEEAKALRERRERQKQVRLIAARQRQRQRLGLPPIEITEEIKPAEEVPVVEDERKEDHTKDALEAALKRAAHVRPWDVGKDGQKNPVMSQEQWVDKKRDERPSEFAPSYVEDTMSSANMNQEFVPVDTVRNRKRLHQFNTTEKQEAMTTTTSSEFYSEISEEPSTSSGRKGAEIPPPTSFDYYNASTSKRKHPEETPATETEKAIEAGLKLLREKVEKEQKAKHKGLLDLM